MNEIDPRLRALLMMEQPTFGEDVASGFSEYFPDMPEEIGAGAGYLADMFNPMRKARYLGTGNPHELTPVSSQSELRKSLGGVGTESKEDMLRELARENNWKNP